MSAAGAVDGVYLCLHGAMRSEESTDPDGELIERGVRALVGPEVPVVVSFDLHAVMTPKKQFTTPARSAPTKPTRTVITKRWANAALSDPDRLRPQADPTQRGLALSADAARRRGDAGLFAANATGLQTHEGDGAGPP